MDNKIIGAAGEHFAMYELLRRGFVATLTPGGVPNVDILVSDDSGRKLAAVQVKTASAKRPGWPLSKKHEEISEDRLFYCFLMPNSGTMADFTSWIIPSSVVARHVLISHKTWLSGTKKDGTPRKDTIRRALSHNFRGLPEFEKGWLDKYENAWESLRT